MKDERHKHKVELREVPIGYITLATEEKKRFWKTAADGAEHEFIRDFFICPTDAVCDAKGSAFIVYIPSGEWTAFKLSYKTALHALQTKPRSDGSLLRAIYTSVLTREDGSSIVGEEILGFQAPENN